MARNRTFAPAQSGRALSAAYGTFAVLLFVAALGLGTVPAIAVIVLLAIGTAAVLIRVDLHVAGLVLACLGCAALPWNGVLVGPSKPGELLMLMALPCFIAASRSGRPVALPGWLTQLAAVILAVVILNEVRPPDPLFDAGRVRLTAVGKPYLGNYSGLLSNIGTGFKFLFAVVLIPIVVSYPIKWWGRKAVDWVALSFCVGTAISAWIAFSDRLGITALGAALGLGAEPGRRQPGLSLHPNFLAVSCVIALPISLYFLYYSENKRFRITGGWVLLGVLLGTYASGSRSGTVGIAVGVLASLVVIKKVRRWAPFVVLTGGLGSFTVLTLFPPLFETFLTATRLGGKASTSGSDYVRSQLAEQGIRDFNHSPIHGIGLQVGTEASSVYLQELASGGLLLLGGMAIYTLGSALSAYRIGKVDPLGSALCASVIAMIALNVFQASLTDRFYYLPQAILVALIGVRHLKPDAAPSPAPDSVTAPDQAASDQDAANRTKV